MSLYKNRIIIIKIKKGSSMSTKNIKAKLPKITKPIVKKQSSFVNNRSSTPKKIIATNDATIRR